MHKKILRASFVAVAALALSVSAQAQGRGNGKNKDKGKHPDEHGRSAVVTSGGEVVVPVQTRRVPPGLAKKPGQMPPGQFKKHYTVVEGGSVLSQVLRQNG